MLTHNHNGFFSISDDNDSPSAFIESSIIESGYEGNNVYDIDPMFVDPSNNDFHVLDGSLSIGAGLDLTTKLSNTVTFRLSDTGGNGFPEDWFIQNEDGEIVLEIPGGDWGSETMYGPFDLPDGNFFSLRIIFAVENKVILSISFTILVSG